VTFLVKRIQSDQGVTKGKGHGRRHLQGIADMASDGILATDDDGLLSAVRKIEDEPLSEQERAWCGQIARTAYRNAWPGMTAPDAVRAASRLRGETRPTVKPRRTAQERQLIKGESWD